MKTTNFRPRSVVYVLKFNPVTQHFKFSAHIVRYTAECHVIFYVNASHENIDMCLLSDAFTSPADAALAAAIRAKMHALKDKLETL